MTPLVSVRNLKKQFPIPGGFFRRPVGFVRAVEDVSFDLAAGETLGLVGESGCGKTTVGRSILRLLEPTSGSVHFDGRDVLSLPPEELRRWRSGAQMIFQDPYASLNPRMCVERVIGEALRIHESGAGDPDGEIVRLLDLVGLGEEVLDKFPHEFSGGQRQRIGIARALAVNPKFIVADEPVSALDVSIQAQIVNLLKDLQETLGLAFLFISHDLRVVEFFAHRVAVMYAGRIVEELPAKELRSGAKHPYTQALLSAVPVADPTRGRSRIVLSGDVPDPAHLPTGCAFHPRCPIAEARCKNEVPVLRELSTGHTVACLLRGHHT